MTCAPEPRSVTAAGGTCASLARRTRAIAFVDRRAHGGIECVDRGGDGLRVDAHGVRADAIEPLGLIAQGVLATFADLGDQARSGLGGDRDIHPRPRHESDQLGAGRARAAEVEGLDHGGPMLRARRDGDAGCHPGARAASRSAQPICAEISRWSSPASHSSTRSSTTSPPSSRRSGVSPPVSRS